MASYDSGYPELPEGICHIVASNLSRPLDLKNWTLTSRACYHAYIPLLYHKVFLRFNQDSEKKVQSFCSPKNKGLQHIRHLRLSPECGCHHYNPDDLQERDAVLSCRCHRRNDRDFDDQEMHWGRVNNMVCTVLRSIPSNQLVSFAAYHDFSSTALGLLGGTQTMLQHCHLNPRHPWTTRAIEKLRLPYLRSFNTAWAERFTKGDAFNHIPQLVGGARIESLTIGIERTTMPVALVSSLNLSKLELYDVCPAGGWDTPGSLPDLSMLQFLRIISCSDLAKILETLQTANNGQPPSLKELYLYQQPTTDPSSVDEDVRKHLGMLLQSFSGLQKLAVYLHIKEGLEQIPIEPNWLLTHASTLETVDLFNWQHGYASLNELTELCTTCPNLRQVGLPFWYNLEMACDPNNTMSRIKKRMSILATLKDLRAVKILGFSNANFFGGECSHPKGDEPCETLYMCILKARAHAFFAHLGAGAESEGRRSRVNIIAFADPLYSDPLIWDQYYFYRDCGWNWRGLENYGELDVLVFARKDYLCADGYLHKTDAQQVSYHDAVYAW